MKNDNPLSPHIQIYNWHISSLISISHRITGIINIIIVTLICIWVALLLLGNSNYDIIQKFFETYFGKFFIVFSISSVNSLICFLCKYVHIFSYCPDLLNTESMSSCF